MVEGHSSQLKPAQLKLKSDVWKYFMLSANDGKDEVYENKKSRKLCP